MPKRKPQTRIRSFGIYRDWDATDKQLPRIETFTTDIPAEIDIEFGLVVHIKAAKNAEIDFCIDHPGIRDDQGRVRAPFTGSVYVKTNDWHFYLGDTIWAPLEDKLGDWRMTVTLHDQLIADKTFHVFHPDENGV